MKNDFTNNDQRAGILIVDDIPKNIQLVAQHLNPLGYKLFFATSGKKGLEIAKSEKPDLIILDIMMPEMNGFEMCLHLKKDPQTRIIPVLFLSARNEIADITKGFEVGGADYMTKPFHGAELIARVERLISSKDFIIRTIEFPQNVFQSGITILNYFGTILKNKQPDFHASVKIELIDNKVAMIIDPVFGKKEIIEEILSKYGKVISGSLMPQDFLNNWAQIADLQKQIEIANLHIEHTTQLLNVTDNRLKKEEERNKQLSSMLETFLKIPSQRNTSLFNINIEKKIARESSAFIEGSVEGKLEIKEINNDWETN